MQLCVMIGTTDSHAIVSYQNLICRFHRQKCLCNCRVSLFLEKNFAQIVYVHNLNVYQTWCFYFYIFRRLSVWLFLDNFQIIYPFHFYSMKKNCKNKFHNYLYKAVCIDSKDFFFLYKTKTLFFYFMTSKISCFYSLKNTQFVNLEPPYYQYQIATVFKKS